MQLGKKCGQERECEWDCERNRECDNGKFYENESSEQGYEVKRE